MTDPLLAMSYLEAYAWFLIVVPVLVVFTLLTIWAVTLTVKWQIWRFRRWKAKRQAEAIRFRSDGLPYPPSGRGICHGCRRTFEKVHYLPDGRRLCPACYELLEMKPDAAELSGSTKESL